MLMSMETLLLKDAKFDTRMGRVGKSKEAYEMGPRVLRTSLFMVFHACVIFVDFTDQKVPILSLTIYSHLA
jgi:hypothetical protein